MGPPLRPSPQLLLQLEEVLPRLRIGPNYLDASRVRAEGRGDGNRLRNRPAGTVQPRPELFDRQSTERVRRVMPRRLRTEPVTVETVEDGSHGRPEEPPDAARR